MIRECTAADAERICFVVNEAAEAYGGVIPDDCWHEPYMPLDELRREMAGMTFFGWEENDGQDARPTRNLVGVMGYQPLEGVTLVRHAYVLPERQGEGIGSRLLEYLVGHGAPTLQGTSSGRLLVGTWKAASWAVRFYERHGFRRLGDAESQELLRRYWEIPARQRETSLVLEIQI
jgi:GNAT superfamily N-acetyltransferase